MSGQAAKRLAWTLWVTVAGLGALQLGLVAIDWTTDVPEVFAFRGWHAVVAVPLATCAALIVTRRSGNPIGWLLFVSALSMAASGVGVEYSIRAILADPGSLPAGETVAWGQSWVASAVVVMAVPGLLLFPDGRLPSPGWRPLAWVSIPGLIALMLAIALAPGPVQDANYVDNPYGIEGLREVTDLGFALELYLLLPACALAPFVRFRRAGRVERQQLKWLAVAGLLFAALQIPVAILTVNDAGVVTVLAQLLFVLSLLAFPVSITVAILRYNLYDIDRIINRTIVYAALTAATLGSYLLLVLGFGWLTRSLVGRGSNELAVAATTLIVAALFQPARRRIQSLVDRRFYRARYDAARTLEDFQSRLRHQTDLESLRNELSSVARETMQPAHLSVWLRGAEGRR